MIDNLKSINHKGLIDLVINGSTKSLPQKDIHKIENILSIMIASKTINDFKALPGYRLHRLKGQFKDFFALNVSGNYRIIFKFNNATGCFYEIDYIDYH